MAKLPICESPTLSAIDQKMEEEQGDWRRGHLGASIIGDPCGRALWYSFRWFTAPKFPGRILRLFRRGQKEEAIIVADLRLAGATVSEGPTEDEQWSFASLGGHFGGSMDAAIVGLLEAPKTWHVGEFKTHNRKSFDLLVKDGVEKSKPKHYAQMQMYMCKFGLTRAVYIGVCKDTDRYYLKRVRYDKYFAGELEDKAERIIFSPSAPPKISDRPDYYLCRWCPHYAVCHQDEPSLEKNCRTCVNSITTQKGWSCGAYGGISLSLDDQKTKAENCPGYSGRG